MVLEIEIIIAVLVLGLYLGWDIVFRRGIKYIEGDEHEQAVRLYNWLTRLAPKHSMSFNNRGYAYYRLGNQTNALEDYHQAIKLNPHNERAIYNLADLHIEMGECAKALSLFSDLIDGNPQDAHAYYARGHAFSKQDDFESAIEDFSRAINILIVSANHTPDIDQPNKSLHPLYETHKTQQQDNALLISCYLVRGICFYYQQDMEKALGNVEQAVDLDPRNKIAVYNRGFFHYHMDNLELALADYEKAIQLDDQFAYPYAGRGKCYFEQGDLQAALENFTRASELETTEHYALASLAVTQHALGEIQIAQAHWRTLLEKNEQHRQPDWLAEEYGWNPPLLRQAEKLMTELDGNEDTGSEAK